MKTFKNCNEIAKTIRKVSLAERASLPAVFTATTVPFLLKESDLANIYMLSVNRDINVSHVNNVKKVIESSDLGEYAPVLMDVRGCIVDRGHSLHARLLLGKDVWAIVIDDKNIEKAGGLIRLLSSLQNVRKWSTQDFLKMYENDEDPQVTGFINFVKEGQKILPLKCISGWISIYFKENIISKKLKEFRIGEFYPFDGREELRRILSENLYLPEIKRLSAKCQFIYAIKRFYMDNGATNTVKLLQELGKMTCGGGNEKEFFKVFASACITLNLTFEVDSTGAVILK